ncbi:MAG: 4Fe-4S dicluster domain-containing protein [Candidatus Kuenenia stuttgartiensis]|nr:MULTISPECIES: 4Fe-4S dicluster domain-containing protein [Kuenenia]MBE7548724.1 4Fe-4S dicluster domain-containing protein [Planctomycetia bacterium]MBZ0191782.1 4Fe-4S dicluster domain-containing protein [Candidatus Kuenenia stuttgartiensis]MCF6150922.1 4Fe-4S dicluster domain-containing protein [Candidatus Kuenenia stuttgartiensis]MCL4728732.1 4Fe-4S dicluster domain-containing protein [Candidatus Kuenenia stuttgartiensis]MCZ7622227.1 4Fe-4S dicluster domain-containing protein [Candidatus
MIKKKQNMVFKGGVNLFDAYKIRFCNIVEEISSDNPPEVFNFTLPSEQSVKHIIVTLCPTEPWALPNWVTLGHKTTVFFDKIKELQTTIFPEAKCSVVITNNETEHISAAKEYAAMNEWLEVFVIDAKYPYDDPVVLSKAILNKDINFGQDTLSQGILVFDAQTALAIHKSRILNKSVNSRFIALSGTGLKENEFIKVQLGTTLEKILKNRVKETAPYRVFINGPLRGMEVNDFAQKIGWTVNDIVVLAAQDKKEMFPMINTDRLHFTTNLLGELRACVYCNFCDDICPVNLEPALYHQAYNRGEKQKVRSYDIEKCIECGLCSFACPSKIELLRIIKECKSPDVQKA